jgi:hypothetical protein
MAQTQALKLEGVQFPATQVASTDPNNFDDYEEGTWVPVLGGDTGATGQTYVTQVGTYTKKGREVTVHFDLQLSVLGTLNGTIAAITGLPFTNSAAGSCSGSVGKALAFASNVQMLGLRINSSTSYIALSGSATTGVNPVIDLAKAVIGATTTISGSITYNV